MRLRVWRAAPVDVVAGWGLRPTTRKAVAYAGKHGLPYVALEDGFLRSFGTGEHFRRCRWWSMMQAFTTIARDPVHWSNC